MKKTAFTLLAVIAAMLAVAPAMAQKNDPKGSKPPHKMTKAPAPAKAKEEKISGGVAKDNFKYPMFEIGVKGKKRITIDASKAKLMNKAGKFAKKDDIKPGSSVTVFGKMVGAKMMATKIIINYTPGAKKPVPMKGKPPVKGKGKG